jgi:hypothetical protein
MSNVRLQDSLFLNNSGVDIRVESAGGCEVIGCVFSQIFNATDGVTFGSGNVFGMQTATYSNTAIDTFLCPAPITASERFRESEGIKPSEESKRSFGFKRSWFSETVSLGLSSPFDESFHVLMWPATTTGGGDPAIENGNVSGEGSGWLVVGIIFAIIATAVAVFFGLRQWRRMSHSRSGRVDPDDSRKSILLSEFEFSTEPQFSPAVVDSSRVSVAELQAFTETDFDELI